MPGFFWNGYVLHTPEIQFLIRCIQDHFCNKETPLVSLKLDWQKVFNSAYQHKMGLFLHHHLQTQFSLFRNDIIFDRFRNRCKRKQNRNIALTLEICRLLKIFLQNNIVVIPFKGATLGDSVYNSVALREFTDNDILIRREDLRKVEAILSQQGYTEKLSFEQRKFRLWHQGSVAWYHSNFSMDVHTQFHPNHFGLYLNKINWKNELIDTSFSNINIKTLSPEAYFLYLSSHGIRHVWSKLIWICDIAKLLQTYSGLDWDKVMFYAKKSRSVKMMHTSLFLCKKVTGINIPYLESISESQEIENIIKCIEKNFCENSTSDYTTMRMNIKIHDTLWARFCSAIIFILSPQYSTIESLKLPRYLYFLYYPYYIIRASFRVLTCTRKIKK